MLVELGNRPDIGRFGITDTNGVHARRDYVVMEQNAMVWGGAKAVEGCELEPLAGYRAHGRSQWLITMDRRDYKRSRHKSGWRDRFSRLRFLRKPLWRVVIVSALVLVIQYLVVPELVLASKDLNLLSRINALWLIAGVVLEVLSLLCYAFLTRVLLPRHGQPSLSRLFRIDLSAAAVAHVIPAGTLGSAGIGYRLFTAEGIAGNDAVVMMASKGLGSTVVLNVLLWVALVVSIPLAGFHPIYGTVAIIGAIILVLIAGLTFGVTHGIGGASRVLAALGSRIPGLRADRLEQAIVDASGSMRAMGRDRGVLVWSLTWASLNWLLDAASLWCFIAAFGHLVNPVELFAAYGIANVAGALPITPGGLGVIDSITPLLLVSFGVTRSVATLGVLAWRLVNFWLPIPTGAAAYISLKVPSGAGPRAVQGDAGSDYAKQS